MYILVNFKCKHNVNHFSFLPCIYSLVVFNKSKSDASIKSYALVINNKISITVFTINFIGIYHLFLYHLKEGVGREVVGGHWNLILVLKGKLCCSPLDWKVHLSHVLPCYVGYDHYHVYMVRDQKLKILILNLGQVS